MSIASSEHDVVVVGGRCAGSATAMVLAGLGHDVVVVDRASLPSDTLSTHTIARTGMVQLARWGVLDDVVASGTPALRHTVFHLGGQHIIRPVKDSAGVDYVVAPRRYVLDRILADAAVAAGAALHTAHTVRGVVRDGDGRVSGVVGDRDGEPFCLRARFVIGADGLRSRIARAVGAPVIEGRPSDGATHYAYYAGIPWPATEYFLGDDALAGIFPTNNGEACVWLCTPAAVAEATRRRHDDYGDAFRAMIADGAPELAARLSAAHRTSPVRGAMRLPNQLRQPTGPGWALVGDAGYHRDAITGHGISDALRDGELLAESIDQVLRGVQDEETASAHFQHQREVALRDIFEITCALGQFPPPNRFVTLQKQLGQVIDSQARWLASRPLPRRVAAAA